LQRVYIDLLRRMLIACVWIQQHGYSFAVTDQYVRDEFYRRGRFQTGDLKTNQQVQQALRFMDHDDFSVVNAGFPEIIADLTKILGSKEPYNDRDLIDTMVRILQLPYSRNIFGYGTIQRLREALLVQEELTAWKNTASKEWICSSCGHKLKNGEMCTLISNGGGNGATMVCTRCARPVCVAADNNKDASVSIDAIKGLSAMLAKKHNAPDPPPAPNLNELLGAEIVAPVAAQAGAWENHDINAGGRRDRNAAYHHIIHNWDAPPAAPAVADVNQAAMDEILDAAQRAAARQAGGGLGE
jgi:hypothetical protein